VSGVSRCEGVGGRRGERGGRAHEITASYNSEPCMKSVQIFIVHLFISKTVPKLVLFERQSDQRQFLYEYCVILLESHVLIHDMDS